MRLSLLLACTAAVATASPIALPADTLKLVTMSTGESTKSIPDQLENISDVTDQAYLEMDKFTGPDYPTLENELYAFSSAMDDLSFTALDDKKKPKLDLDDSEDVLDGLSNTKTHYVNLMSQLENKQYTLSKEQLKAVANILYNVKVSTAMAMSAIADITTRKEDITYLTKPYNDSVFKAWRAYEKAANPEWYVPDENQVDTTPATEDD